MLKNITLVGGVSSAGKSSVGMQGDFHFTGTVAAVGTVTAKGGNNLAQDSESYGVENLCSGSMNVTAAKGGNADSFSYGINNQMGTVNAGSAAAGSVNETYGASYGVQNGNCSGKGTVNVNSAAGGIALNGGESYGIENFSGTVNADTVTGGTVMGNGGSSIGVENSGTVNVGTATGGSATGHDGYSLGIENDGVTNVGTAAAGRASTYYDVYNFGDNTVNVGTEKNNAQHGSNINHSANVVKTVQLNAGSGNNCVLSKITVASNVSTTVGTLPSVCDANGRLWTWFTDAACTQQAGTSLDSTVSALYAALFFKITLPSDPGYTITAANDSATLARSGGSYSFTLHLDDNYSQSNPVVTANGTALTADGNDVYTISNITANQNIQVTGLQRNTHQVTADGGFLDISNHYGLSGTQTATVGDTVGVDAKVPPGGEVFDKWIVETGSVSFADVNSDHTSFTMPNSDVVVKATYKTPTPVSTADAGGLQTALSDAANAQGGTVTLTQDVTGSSGGTNIKVTMPYDETVVLDGGGHTLTAAGNSSGDSVALTVSGYGTLILKNITLAGSTGGGNNSRSVGLLCDSDFSGRVVSEGNVIVQGGDDPSGTSAGVENRGEGSADITTATGGSAIYSLGARNVGGGTVNVATATGGSAVFSYGVFNSNRRSTMNVATATGGNGATNSYGVVNCLDGCVNVTAATGGAATTRSCGVDNFCWGTVNAGTATGGNAATCYDINNDGSGTVNVKTETNNKQTGAAIHKGSDKVKTISLIVINGYGGGVLPEITIAGSGDTTVGALPAVCDTTNGIWNWYTDEACTKLAGTSLASSTSVLYATRFLKVTTPSNAGYTVTAVNGSANQVKFGENYSFKVDLDSAYDKSIPVVQANGVTLTADSNGVYTISGITTDQNISVTGVTPNTYQVNLPSSPVGYTIVPESDSASPVSSGRTYQFQVNLDDRYNQSKPVVKVNNTTLTADSKGVYTISNITADQTIAVTGVQLNTHTVTVTGGTLGDGHSTTASYPVGTSVNITASAASAGQLFKWKGDGVAFADASNPNTSFSMPNSDVTVTATYLEALSQVQSDLNSAVSSGGTATLTQDAGGNANDTNLNISIPSGTTVTLDGSGHTITAADSSGGDSIALTVSGAGTLILKNITLVGGVSGASNNSIGLQGDANFTGTVAVVGTVAANGGNNSSSNGSYGVYNRGGGSINITTAVGGAAKEISGGVSNHSNSTGGTVNVGTATGGSAASSYGVYNNNGVVNTDTATGGSAANSYGVFNFNDSTTTNVNTATGSSDDVLNCGNGIIHVGQETHNKSSGSNIYTGSAVKTVTLNAGGGTCVLPKLTVGASGSATVGTLPAVCDASGNIWTWYNRYGIHARGFHAARQRGHHTVCKMGKCERPRFDGERWHRKWRFCAGYDCDDHRYGSRWTSV